MGWRLSRNSPPVMSLPCTTGRGTALSDRPSDTAPSTSQAAPRKPSAEAVGAHHLREGPAGPWPPEHQNEQEGELAGDEEIGTHRRPARRAPVERHADRAQRAPAATAGVPSGRSFVMSPHYAGPAPFHQGRRSRPMSWRHGRRLPS